MLVSRAAGGIGQNGRAARTEVLIDRIERVVVIGRKVIDNFKTPAVQVGALTALACGRIEGQLDEGIAIVAVNGKAVGIKSRHDIIGVVSIEIAVASFKVDVAVGVDDHAAAALPNTAFALAAVGRRAPRAGVCQAGCVVGQNPAVVRLVVAMARRRDINLPVVKF